MSYEITTAFVKQFEAGVTTLSQQKGSKLINYVTVKPNVTGERTFMDQIGATSVVERTSRHGDSPLIQTPHYRRAIDMREYEWGDLIDKVDTLKALNSFESPYVQNAGYAMGRQIDDTIIDAFFATAYIGKEGTSTVAFDSNNVVAADYDGDTVEEGLTIAKLRAARKILLQNEVDLDMEQPYIAVTATQLDNLLATVEVTSMEFNSVKALVEGSITRFMGFEFVHTERLDVSGDDRLIPVWVPSAMGLALPMAPTSRIAERADKSFSWYAYYAMSLGASRLEEEKVVKILCDE